MFEALQTVESATHSNKLRALDYICQNLCKNILKDLPPNPSSIALDISP